MCYRRFGGEGPQIGGCGIANQSVGYRNVGCEGRQIGRGGTTKGEKCQVCLGIARWSVCIVKEQLNSSFAVVPGACCWDLGGWVLSRFRGRSAPPFMSDPPQAKGKGGGAWGRRLGGEGPHTRACGSADWAVRDRRYGYLGPQVRARGDRRLGCVGPQSRRRGTADRGVWDRRFGGAGPQIRGSGTTE